MKYRRYLSLLFVPFLFLPEYSCLINRKEDHIVQLDEEYSFKSESTKKIMFDCYATDIYLEQREDISDIEIKLEGKTSSNLAFDISDNNSTIKVNQSVVDKHTQINQNQSVVKMKVPSNVPYVYDIKMYAGEIHMDSCDTEKFVINLKCGDVFCNNSSSKEKSKIKVRTGDINITDFKSDKDKLETSVTLGDVTHN